MKRQLPQKVYCKYCKHFNEKRVQCNAPSNFKDTFYAPRNTRDLEPDEKNENNDCTDYKKKRFISDVKEFKEVEKKAELPLMYSSEEVKSFMNKIISSSDPSEIAYKVIGIIKRNEKETK